MRIVQLTSLVEIGILPDPGGALDQPAGLMTAMGIVSSAKREAMKNGNR